MFIMPDRKTPPSTENSGPPEASPSAPGSMAEGSTSRYRDRPTDDGMKGDGADEPNEGSPRLPKQGPSRRTHTTPTRSTSTK
jgi:hypothetical protein